MHHSCGVCTLARGVPSSIYLVPCVCGLESVDPVSTLVAPQFGPGARRGARRGRGAPLQLCQLCLWHAQSPVHIFLVINTVQCAIYSRSLFVPRGG